MKLLPDQVLQERLQRLAKYFTYAVMVIALLTLIGWQWDIVILRRPIPGLVSMNPLTACCFLIESLAFLLLMAPHRPNNIAGILIAISAVLIACFRLADLVNGSTFEVDRILFHKKLLPGLPEANSVRMALLTASNFVLLGIALLCFHSRKKSLFIFSQVLTSIAGCIALLAIVGYLFGVQAFYKLIRYNPMAIHTAACFLLFVLALFFSEPRKGIMKEFTSTYAGSILARSIIPLAALVPCVLGFLQLYAYRANVFTTEFGTALLVLGTIAFFVGLVWYSAARLNREDALRKESENNLLLSEQRFGMLLNSVKDYAIFMIDMEGHIISWNKGAENIKGYTAEEVIGKHVSIFYTEEQKANGELMRNLQLARENGKCESEGWRIRKDGSRFWANIIFTAVYDSNQQFRGYAKITRDITQKKKADDRFRSLLEAAPDAMVIVNGRGEIVLINHQTEIIFGYKKEELIGKPVEMLIPPDSRGKHTGHRGNYFANPKLRSMGSGLELFAMRKDGSFFPVEISLSPIETEEGLLVSASVRDISERKKDHERISYMARLIEDTSDAVISSDSFFIIRTWNRAAEKLYGYSAQKAIGEGMEKLLRAQISNEERQSIRAELFRLGYWTGEVTYLNNLNEPLTVLISISEIKNAQNEPEGYIMVCRDISPRKLLEAQLRKFNSELEKQVRSKTAELTSIFERISDAFIAFDKDGQFTYVNKKAAELNKCRPEELIGKNIWTEFPVEVTSPFHEHFQKALATQQNAAFEMFSPTLQIWTENYIYPSPDGVSHFFRDITEKRMAEEQLRLSEKKYKLLFESNPLPMWMLSLSDLSFIDVNEAALKHYGYTRDEFLAMDGVKIRPDDDGQKFTTEAKRMVPGLSYRGIWRHKKKDGTIIHVEIYANDLVYEGQKVRLVLSNDITEKLKTEQELKQSYDDIRQLASHLQDVREEERAGIAREIHDELGQQLTGLKMDMFWFSKKLGPTEDSSIRTKMNNTVVLLDNTIRTVRRISTELHPSILDDLGLIAAIEWYGQEFEKRSGVSTQFRCNAEQLAFLPTVAAAMFRICQESLTNVARYAEAQNVCISLMVSENDGQIMLSIADDGKGFDPAANRKRKSLGLIGMRERTLMMKGKFDIRSAPGKGTIVNVNVPLNEVTST